MTTVIINLTDVFGRPINGKIRFTPTGSTIDGNVLIAGSSALTGTDANGTVSITVEPGNYTAVLQAPSSGSYEVTVPTTNNGTVFFTECISNGVNPSITYSLPVDGNIYRYEGGFWVVVTDLNTVARRVEFISSTQFYKGEALAGTLNATANWRISRTTISGATVTVLWASGNANFDKIWNNRAALSYS